VRLAYVRGNFGFEDVFAPPPYFELAETRLLVLRALFEKVNPRFPIDPRDLKVNNVDNLGDLRVTMAAFGGVGRVEVAPAFSKVSFEQLRLPADWDVAAEFVGLVDEALRRFIPLERVAARSVNRLVYYNVEADGPFNVDEFLTGLLSEKARIDPAKLGALRCHAGVQVKADAGVYSTELLLEKSAVQEAVLFVHSHTRYLKVVNSRQSIDDSKQRTRDILAAYGLELP
jgi:hypothetical protein